MKKYLFRVARSSLVFLLIFLLVGCQSVTQPPSSLTPMVAPIYQPLLPMADVKTLDASVLVTAFQKLDRSDSYRVTWATVTSSDSRTSYIFEKKGQGKFRMIEHPQGEDSKEVLSIDGKVYEQYEKYSWRLVSDDSYSFLAKEFGLFVIPFKDTGCSFDPEYPAEIHYAYYGTDDFSPSIVIGFTHSGYMRVDPTPICEVAINADGLPYRLISTNPNVDWYEYMGVVLFSNFDGEDIDPIVAPQISAPPLQ